MSTDYTEVGVIDTITQDVSLINIITQKTSTAKILSINQHLGSVFQSFRYDINKVAVMQNQNFDRMYNF